MATKTAGRKVTIGEEEKPEDVQTPDVDEMDDTDVVEDTPDETSTEDEEEEYDIENMDPEDTLWEDGPTFGQIKAWKEEYGDVYVTSVTPTSHIVWRTVTRFEYRNMVKNLEQAISTGQVTQAEANLNNEESLAELCVLYPPYSRVNSTGVMAGVASTIAQQVMEASAFVSMEVRQL